MNPVEVRSQLVDALRLDLVGPDAVRSLGVPDEVLPQPPSRWYLTGFLVPLEAGVSQRAEETSVDEMDQAGERGGTDDDATPEPTPARLAFMPSSLGLSFLVRPETKRLEIIIRWGDYVPLSAVSGQLTDLSSETRTEAAPVDAGRTADSGQRSNAWQRAGSEQIVVFEVPDRTPQPIEMDVPDSQGLRAVLSVRPVSSDGKAGAVPVGTRSVSVFVVNRRMTTGPAACGAVSRDTSVVVREMFAHAEKSVLVAGYAVYQGQHVLRALADRMQELPQLSVRMFLDVQRGGDTAVEREVVRRFAERFKTR
ncbi:MAG: hypothetical protein NTY19_05570 [Planctomycetota bacterium]|nr:hypothetical protein [Planctomycetota bacterium]